MSLAILVAFCFAAGVKGQPALILPVLEVTNTATFNIEIVADSANPGAYEGNFTIGLFGNVLPNTVARFLSFVRGTGPGNTYELTTFHRIIKGFIIQGGDLTGENGQSGYTNTALWFPSENFDIKHFGAGWVSMANGGQINGQDTNGSQFFITLSQTSELDGQNVVFGKVLSGMAVIRIIEQVTVDPRNNDKPLRRVIVRRCTAENLAAPFPIELRAPTSENA